MDYSPPENVLKDFNGRNLRNRVGAKEKIDWRKK